MKTLMPKLIYASLLFLALGLFTSITLMAGFHILIAAPIIYYAPKYNWKKFPKSAWALLAFSVIIILSVILNQDVIDNGYKDITKVKYFVIAALSIIPLDFYFNEYLKGEEKTKVIRNLVLTFLLSSSVASLAGIVGYFTGVNPIKFNTVTMERSSGMFGMLITYAHSVSLLCTLLAVMFLNRKKLIQYAPSWAIITALLINFYGLFTTYTRGALIAFFASLIFVNKKIAIAAISISLVASIILSITVHEYFENNILRSKSNDERMMMWKSSIEAFKERPILGYGYQNFEPHSTEMIIKHKIPGIIFHGHAHNNFLEILATTGLLGLLTMLCWNAFWILEVIKKGNLTFILVFPYIVNFLIGGITQVTINDGEVQFFFLTVYALSVVSTGNGKLWDSNTPT